MQLRQKQEQLQLMGVSIDNARAQPALQLESAVPELEKHRQQQSQLRLDTGAATLWNKRATVYEPFEPKWTGKNSQRNKSALQ